MLGLEVSDPDGVEGGGCIPGMGLLPVSTVLAGDKKTEQFIGTITASEGLLAGLAGLETEGYEIHMGRTAACEDADGREFTSGGTGMCSGNVYGTYIHGFFDRGEIASEVVRSLAKSKGVKLTTGQVSDHIDFKEKEYDRLADILRAHLDMDKIYGMLREAAF